MVDSQSDEPREQLSGWPEYYRQHEKRKPRPELVESLRAVQELHSDLSAVAALEVGAGAMVEARALLEAGVGRVVATDVTPDAERRSMGLSLKYNQDAVDFDRFEYYSVRNEDLPEMLTPHSYDLIVSYNTLSFTRPDKLGDSWQALREALRPGGVISISFFGDRDEWSTKYPGMSFVSRDEVVELARGLEDVSVHESEGEISETSGETRHSHIVTLAARAPVSTDDTATI